MAAYIPFSAAGRKYRIRVCPVYAATLGSPRESLYISEALRLIRVASAAVESGTFADGLPLTCPAGRVIGSAWTLAGAAA